MTPPCKHCGKRREEHYRRTWAKGGGFDLFCDNSGARVDYRPADYFDGLREAQRLAKDLVIATDTEYFEPGRGRLRELDFDDFDRAIEEKCK